MEIVKFDKPKLPVHWEYKDSIKYVSDYVFKWKNITADIAKELWIARELLSKTGRKWNKSSDKKTWAEYCEDIGSSKQVVNRWLKQWFEQVHVSQNSGENEWYTPPKYIESAKNIMGNIDLDPATSEQANQAIQAEHIYTANDNGLEQDWYGNIWMNPPYSQPEISEFSQKLIKELPNIKQACVLVNNATETNWLQNMMAECKAICFIKGRIKYINIEGNAANSPLQGQVILYYGENINQFINEFSKHGICLMNVK